MELSDAIRKWTLKNAADYKLAIPAKIIGKVIGEVPSAKEDMKGTMAKINEEAKRVNALPIEQVEGELGAYSFEEKKEEKREIELEGALAGKVVTRFAPEPSGYPHIGHAKAAFLEYVPVQKYGGKMLLRFDDTNPEKEKVEFVQAIKDGLLWLGISWQEETYTSDRMEEFYAYAQELMVKNCAYVCTCDAQEIKKNRMGMHECDCRVRDGQENLLLWKKMMGGNVAAGGAIVRFRGDMHAQNTVLRDPTLFRIIEGAHYRQGEKYRVWPSYDFAAPIMDSLEGVTHAMRSKEYELRDELYFLILKKLELRAPRLVGFSRLAIKGAPVSKRLITPLIQEGKVSGYDDPRLPTLVALKRRGMQPQAIQEFVLSFGLSKVESEPGWEKLLNENKKIIDPKSMRRYFVKNPVKLNVMGAIESIRKEARIKNHPIKDMGERVVQVQGNFYIAGADAATLQPDETFRLKDLYNVKVAKVGEEIIGAHAGEEMIVGKKMQWVDAQSAIKCEVLVAGDLFVGEKYNEKSLSVDSGLCESACAQLEIGDIVQFERYGFVRLDKKEEGKLVFVFVSG